MERDLRAKLPNGRFQGTSPQRSATMRAIKGRDNRTTERRLRLALVRAGISGWAVCPKHVPGNPDFWFEQQQLAVFVDGCFWHGCPSCGRSPKSNTEFWTAKIERNRAKDMAASAALEKTGAKVLRIWEHELKRGLADCVAAVARAAHSPCAVV